MRDDGKQVVLDYYERLTRYDVAADVKLFSDYCTATVADPPLDREAYLELLRSCLTVFSDLPNTVEEVVAEGPIVALPSAWEGTHRAAFVGSHRSAGGCGTSRSPLVTWGLDGSPSTSFSPTCSAPCSRSATCPSGRRPKERRPRDLKDLSAAFRTIPAAE